MKYLVGSIELGDELFTCLLSPWDPMALSLKNYGNPTDPIATFKLQNPSYDSPARRALLQF